MPDARLCLQGKSMKQPRSTSPVRLAQQLGSSLRPTRARNMHSVHGELFLCTVQVCMQSMWTCGRTCLRACGRVCLCACMRVPAS